MIITKIRVEVSLLFIGVDPQTVIVRDLQICNKSEVTIFLAKKKQTLVLNCGY